MKYLLQKKRRIKNIWTKSLVVLALLTTTAVADKGDMYLGVQSNGLSGKYDVTDKITAQALLGFWGTVSSYTGKLNYKIIQKENWNVYGSVSAGMLVCDGTTYTYDYYTGYRGHHETETTPTFGIGGGYEFDNSTP